jgi:hypothetical protein
MFSLALIQIGVGVYYFDEGHNFNIAITLLSLGVFLIICGIWTFYNILYPTILFALVYTGLFFFIWINTPEYILNRASITYMTMIAFAIIGSIMDALKLKKGQGINDLEYIPPIEVIPIRVKPKWQQKIEKSLKKSNLGQKIVNLDGADIVTFIVYIFGALVGLFILFLIGAFIYLAITGQY